MVVFPCGGAGRGTAKVTWGEEVTATCCPSNMQTGTVYTAENGVQTSLPGCGGPYQGPQTLQPLGRVLPRTAAIVDLKREKWLTEIWCWGALDEPLGVVC